MRESNSKKTLPWWVELFFVQIGLPDTWLRGYLKAKKRGFVIIKENKSSIGITSLLVVMMAYFYPVIELSNIHNECVRESQEYIKEKLAGKELLSDSEVKALATSFCNGGNI